MWEYITIFKMSREKVWTSCPSCDTFKWMCTACLFYVTLFILLIQIFVGIWISVKVFMDFQVVFNYWLNSIVTWVRFRLC